MTIFVWAMLMVCIVLGVAWVHGPGGTGERPRFTAADVAACHDWQSIRDRFLARAPSLTVASGIATFDRDARSADDPRLRAALTVVAQSLARGDLSQFLNSSQEILTVCATVAR
jgi:hypothetical protein